MNKKSNQVSKSKSKMQSLKSKLYMYTKKDKKYLQTIIISIHTTSMVAVTIAWSWDIKKDFVRTVSIPLQARSKGYYNRLWPLYWITNINRVTVGGTVMLCQDILHHNFSSRVCSSCFPCIHNVSIASIIYGWVTVVVCFRIFCKHSTSLVYFYFVTNLYITVGLQHSYYYTRILH